MAPLTTVALYALLSGTLAVQSFAFGSYANTFIDPDYILAKQFNASTKPAQDSVVQWAEQLAAQGPWSVVNKPAPAASGDIHDYMSFAPYWWPNCTSVGNTTELAPQEVWTKCTYYNRDGLFNPDYLSVNNSGAFEALADAVFYNSLAWVVTGDTQYSANAAKFTKAWFLDQDTAMNPNLNYAQMIRGPGNTGGTHTGILDLKCMTKVVSGLLILRQGQSSDWPSDVDAQMTNWTTHYISWLQTAKIAVQEGVAANNHGTFYYNQLAALQVYVKDNNGANATLQKYFSTQYQMQINSNGEQPFEAIRTRPYHYRAYNLAAMIVNAQLSKYIGEDVWSVKTKAGATIQNALDYAMTAAPASNETDAAAELYPDVAAVASTYGDPDGKYARFLAQGDGQYPAEPYFLWSQPLSDSGIKVASNSSGGGQEHNAAAGVHVRTPVWKEVQAGLLVAALVMRWFI